MNRLFYHIFVYFILSICFFAYDSFAARNNLYVISNLSVSADASSSSEAKTLAINNAKIKAFNTFIKRVVPKQNVYDVKIPTADELEKFIYSVNIESEKTSETSYEGIVNIVINSKTINDYLTSNAVEYITVNIPSSVVVFKNGNICEFHDGEEYTNPNDESGYKFTFADTDELDSLNCPNYSCYTALMLKNNADTVMTVETKPVTVEKYKFILKDKLFDSEYEVMLPVENCSSSLITHIAEAFKIAMLKQSNNNNETFIVSSIYSIKDYLNLKNKLANLNVIKDISLSALNYHKAQFKVKYNYNIDSLISAIESIGLSVRNKRDYLLIRR